MSQITHLISSTGVVQGIITGMRGLCSGLGPAVFGFIFYLFHVDLNQEQADDSSQRVRLAFCVILYLWYKLSLIIATLVISRIYVQFHICDFSMNLALYRILSEFYGDLKYVTLSSIYLSYMCKKTHSFRCPCGQHSQPLSFLSPMVPFLAMGQHLTSPAAPTWCLGLHLCSGRYWSSVPSWLLLSFLRALSNLENNQV